MQYSIKSFTIAVSFIDFILTNLSAGGNVVRGRGRADYQTIIEDLNNLGGKSYE